MGSIMPIQHAIFADKPHFKCAWNPFFTERVARELVNNIFAI